MALAGLLLGWAAVVFGIIVIAGLAVFAVAHTGHAIPAVPGAPPQPPGG